MEASRAALQETMRRIELPVGGLSDPVDPDSILRALLAGYFMQVCLYVHVYAQIFAAGFKWRDRKED